jgi:hypothetical protein
LFQNKHQQFSGIDPLPTRSELSHQNTRATVGFCFTPLGLHLFSIFLLEFAGFCFLGIFWASEGDLDCFFGYFWDDFGRERGDFD